MKLSEARSTNMVRDLNPVINRKYLDARVQDGDLTIETKQEMQEVMMELKERNIARDGKGQPMTV